MPTDLVRCPIERAGGPPDRALPRSAHPSGYGRWMATAGGVDITDWETIQLEARGSGPNQWRRDPQGVRWLYKATRVATITGELQGEDWAEKAAEGLAQLLGVPCAATELAHRR